MDKEYEIYTLEDGNEYDVIDEIESGNATYLLLAEQNNLKNLVIRKLIYNSVTGEESVEKLDMDEFDEWINNFIKKNKDLFD